MQEIVNRYGPNHELEGVRLSQHFLLQEFIHLRRHPENIPTAQDIANLTYGCLMVLEPARLIAGSTWLHVSWTPFDKPRHMIRIGYYK